MNGNTFDADPPKEDQSVEDPKHPTEEDADEPSNNNDALIDEDENNDNELVINPASRIWLTITEPCSQWLNPGLRSQESETREHLLIGVSAKTFDKDRFVIPINKKQRKLRKKLEIQLQEKGRRD